MQEQIFKDLEKIGTKFSKIEVELGMPKNYLSRFKNPENKLPKKWVPSLLDFIKKYEDKASGQSDIPVQQSIESIPALQPWIKLIEEYCGTAGITPEELIEQHAKKVTKPTKSEASKSSDDQKEAAKFVARGMSNYDLERRKIKNGF